MQAQVAQPEKFDVLEEFNKTILQSLVSSFGIDFLLLEDKRGGDVDTIHNVRNGIYATETERERYNNRGEYNSHEYHSHANYIENNRRNAKKQQEGTLVDGYTGKIVEKNEKMDLDHIKSAHDIHNDRGRVLAEIDGASLANKDENLVSTHRSINRSKKADDIEKFLAKNQSKIINKQAQLDDKKRKLADLTQNTSANKAEIEKLKKAIANDEIYIEKHQQIDKEMALKQKQKAEEAIERDINYTYYMGSKFLKNTAFASHNQGLQMGKRQAIGLLFAEIWFELKEAIPAIYSHHKVNFTFESFIKDIVKTLKRIFKRIEKRFFDLLTEFSNGYIGGILSSINTTILNIFLTTEKLISKLLRELWTSLAKAGKVLFFNPDNLPLGDRIREACKILAIGVSVVLGAIIQQQLSTSLRVPFFGDEISSFISAVASGVMSLGAIYFLEHSAMMKKVWDMLNALRNKPQPKFQSQIQLDEYYQKINEELDCYLYELAQIELGMNPDELSAFANELGIAKTEIERKEILDKEIAHRNIKLPFESGGMKTYLLKKCQKF